MNIEEFAQKFIEAEKESWYKGNYEPLEALIDPEVVGHSSQLPEVRGLEALKQYVLGMQQVLTNPQHEWTFLVGEGNLFALSYRLRATFSSEVPGMPIPKGKEFTNDSLILYRLENEKIVELWMNSSISIVD